MQTIFFLSNFALVLINGLHLRFNQSAANTIHSDRSNAPFDAIPFNAIPFDASNTFVNCTHYNQYTAQCDNKGVCWSNGNCKCDEGYITWPSDNTVGCNYKQKSQLISFLLSFFLGEVSGAGEWYLGNTDMALAQLLVFVVGIVFVCLVSCACACASQDGDAGVCAGGCFGCMWVLAVVGLWLFVWITILAGYSTDGNGAPLAPM